MPKNPSTPSQRGKRARQKGAAHEREVAEKLRAVYPDAKRGLGQARAGGEVPDVDGTPFWCELKHRKALNVHGAFRQALLARATRHGLGLPHAQPVLVVTRLHGESRDLATVDLDLFLKLMGELEFLRDITRG